MFRALALPIGLLVAGAALGLSFTLDPGVGWERFRGLVIDGALACLVLLAIQAASDSAIRKSLWLLLGATILSALWVVAASGPEVVRGPAGRVLEPAFSLLYGRATLRDPVELTNTRFIVGYNGLADLALVAIAISTVLLLKQPRTLRLAPPLLIVGASLITLLATGSRGGLTGLVVGAWVLALLALRRGWIVAAVSVPIALALAAAGVLDKGLELSSTTGRLSMWSDLVRLLVEFPATGVGLGVDTANRVALLYEVNPDPERIAYAHNTFVQTYLEQGPLGFSGAVSVLAIGAIAAWCLPRSSAAGGPRSRQVLGAAALALGAGLEAHGLTDQVVTTNVGTAMVLVCLATALACVGPGGAGLVLRWTGRWALVVASVLGVGSLWLVGTPPGRAQLMLNFGSLQLDQALLQGAPIDGARLRSAETFFGLGLGQDASHPALLREVARARLARFDTNGAQEAINQAAATSRIDAFDMLQIAHVYRDLGFSDAYLWAERAFATWGRPPNQPIMLPYQEATLPDDPRVRTLASQGEAALHARDLPQALSDFQQALAFAPDSAYLSNRVRGVRTAIERQAGTPAP